MVYVDARPTQAQATTGATQRTAPSAAPAVQARANGTGTSAPVPTPRRIERVVPCARSTGGRRSRHT